MIPAEAEGRPELETRWSAWLITRNRRGTLLSLWMVMILYPLFGVLDLLVAPRASLWLLLNTRVLVTIVTVCMFRVVGSPIFARHSNSISSAYQVLISCGISLMTVFMGGLASPYYAGLSLILVGIGLLFVWPPRVVASTQIGIVASFVIPNLFLNPRSWGFAAFSNLLFLCSTALIGGAGQFLGYRIHREQIKNQMVIESTKADLERAHSKLQRIDRFKSEFFANVTHELKTPLTMILAPLELMLLGEMGNLTESQRASLESMLRSGAKLLKMIDDLLDLSKLDESRLRLQISEHDLVSHLRDMVGQVQSLAQRKAIELTFETDVRVCLVYCDLERLERVFINLLSNAAKFTPSGGWIRLRLLDKGPRVEISVADSGVGFPTEVAQRLFERFFQVKYEKSRKIGGTGIGLALAKELVLLHGGTIRAESPESGGAVFTVELIKDREHFDSDHIDRRTKRQDRLDGQRATDGGIGEWHVGATGRHRFIDFDEATEQRIVDRDADEHTRAQSVLVVEDTPDVIRVIHLVLRRQFRVFAASDGAKGFDVAVKHRPSLIITDFMMPEMDGLELTRRIRKDPRTRHIPVVMLTARGEVEDRVAGLQAGVNAYLTKPFAAKELISAARGLVKIQETTADILLNENMHSLKTIAGGLAHEINNPLNYIKNAVKLIQREARSLPSLVRERADPGTIEKASERMERMFEVTESGLKRIGATVTLMQRYSRDGYTRTLQAVDVFQVAQDVVSALEIGRSKRIIETSFDGSGELECVPEEINQVLTNLIQNALDVIPPQKGQVLVNGYECDGCIVVSVADNGCGIPEENRTRIFSPFFTTKDVGAGMGLGLAIVHRVVTSLGGTVNVTSIVGRGSEFVVCVPRRTRVGT